MFPLSVTFESLNQMTSILSARREFYLTQMIFYVPAHQPNTVYRAGEQTDGRHDNARHFGRIIMCSVCFCSPACLVTLPL